MATVKLPTPYEPLVDTDGKIAEVWYRYFSESAISANSLSSALAAITTVSTISISYATQADQEASTATAAIVTPSVQQYHPSATKAWGLVRVTTAGVMTLSTGYNVASVSTAGGVGTLTVNLTVPFATSNYAVTATINHQTSAASNNTVGVGTLASSQFTLSNFNTTGAADPEMYNFACYGDQ